MFTSPFLDDTVERLALNTRVVGQWGDKLIAASSGWNMMKDVVFHKKKEFEIKMFEKISKLPLQFG